MFKTKPRTIEMSLCDKHIKELAADKELGLSYFINKYEESLSFFAYKITRNTEATEEIVSESFFKLWQRRHKLPNADFVRSFLFLVTRNACYDYINSVQEKQIRSHEELPLDIEENRTDILMEIIYAELIEQVAAELDKLPKQQAQIFRMSYLEGMETSEICEELNTSASTVYFSRSKALVTLRKALEKKDINLYLSLIALHFLN